MALELLEEIELKYKKLKNKKYDENKYYLKYIEYMPYYISNSCLLNNNTFILKEIRELIEENKVFKNHSYTCHEEVVSTKRALDFVYLKALKDDVITAKLIKKIHNLIVPGDFEFRTNDYTYFDDGMIVEARYLEDKLNELFNELENFIFQQKEQLNFDSLFDHLAELSLKFVRYEPFNIASEAVARLLINYVLLRLRLIPLLFEVKDRAKYYATLKAGKENLKEYLLDDFLESLNFYLR